MSILQEEPKESYTAAELREIAEKLQDAAREHGRNLGLRELAERAIVCWNSRLRTTAGLAQYRRWIIYLNPRLLFFSGELARTFLHELAHLVAHARNSKRKIEPHGKEWQQACADLGIGEESRCHTLPLAPRRQVARRYFYHCPKCLKEIARVRPFRRKEACVVCCRAHAGGDYDSRFRFVLKPAQEVVEAMEEKEILDVQVELKVKTEGEKMHEGMVQMELFRL